jgi:hypothetical protein
MKSKVIQGKSAPAVVYRRDGSARTAGAITKARGGYTIADTATTAKKGDIYRPETATTSVMVGKEYTVIDASTNSFTIASKDLPTLGDTFYILAKTTQRVGSDGATAISTTGLATEAKQDTQITSLAAIKTAVELIDNAVSGNELQVDVVAALPAGDNNIGNVDIVTLPAIPAGTNNIGDVDIAGPGTGAVTPVAYSASNQTALSSNANRKGAKFFNNTDGDAYVKLAATATTSDFSVKISAGGYYNLEVPVYTGIIDVIFANGTAGNLLVTELT